MLVAFNIHFSPELRRSEMLLSMPNTYSQIYVHIVFAVKGRECFIKESFREELQKYISGIINNKKEAICHLLYARPYTFIY